MSKAVKTLEFWAAFLPLVFVLQVAKQSRTGRLLAGLLLVCLLLSSCGNLYESASCDRGCRDDYNTCLYLAFAQGQTPGGERGNWILLFLSCESAYSVCRNTCGGTSRL